MLQGPQGDIFNRYLCLCARGTGVDAIFEALRRATRGFQWDLNGSKAVCEAFCRCFKDMEEYKARVLERQPIRMEIGAVFSHAPSKHNVIAKEAIEDMELKEK